MIITVLYEVKCKKKYVYIYKFNSKQNLYVNVSALIFSQMIIWKDTASNLIRTAIFCCLNCGHPGVFSWYSPWCSTSMVDRPQVLLEAEEKNGVKDSPSICPGVEGRPAISKNVGAKSMFITCSCYLINIVINSYVVGTCKFYQNNYHVNRKLNGQPLRGCESIDLIEFSLITMHCPNKQSPPPLHVLLLIFSK